MRSHLLTSLKDGTRGETVFHTFGNNHYSLIGLLVDWWVSSGPQRDVLEAPPWYASKADKGLPSDAVLMENGVCRGIVEVEGTNYSKAIDRMLKYIVPENRFWRMDFGVFLAYPTKRKYLEESLPIDDFVKKGKAVTKDHQIQLAVLVLDKIWEEQTQGPRARGPQGQKNYEHVYYNGTPSRLTGTLIENGEEITERCLFRRA